MSLQIIRALIWFSCCIVTPGVESLHVDQKNSKVTVYGTVKPQVVLDKVLRAGKTAEFWPQPDETAKEVGAAAKEECIQVVVKEVVGGKKKASDAGGNATKKQKKGKESKEETELEAFGDGEIVDETDIPASEGDDESDERVLIKSEKLRKKGVFRKR